jgi:hypothetical protein
MVHKGAMTKDDVLNEIQADFQYEGWTVSGRSNSALLLQRDGKAYRVEVLELDAQPLESEED